MLTSIPWALVILLIMGLYITWQARKSTKKFNEVSKRMDEHLASIDMVASNRMRSSGYHVKVSPRR